MMNLFRTLASMGLTLRKVEPGDLATMRDLLQAA